MGVVGGVDGVDGVVRLDNPPKLGQILDKERAEGVAGVSAVIRVYESYVDVGSSVYPCPKGVLESRCDELFDGVDVVGRDVEVLGVVRSPS